MFIQYAILQLQIVPSGLHFKVTYLDVGNFCAQSKGLEQLFMMFLSKFSLGYRNLILRFTDSTKPNLTEIGKK